VTQRAAVWQSTELNSGWRRLDLPEPGQRSDAVSAGCTAGRCLLSGSVDGRYALWSVEGGTASRLTGLPDLAVDEKTAMPAPILLGDHVVAIAPTGERSGLLVGGDRPWTGSPGPGGLITSSALVGDWLYVLSSADGGPARLWRCPVAPLR
jgi:hypothetical protein